MHQIWTLHVLTYNEKLKGWLLDWLMALWYLDDDKIIFVITGNEISILAQIISKNSIFINKPLAFAVYASVPLLFHQQS